MLRGPFLVGLLCMVPGAISAGTLSAYEPSVIVRWNLAAALATHDARVSAPVASRVLAITATCMYDAWAAYDQVAVGTQMAGVLRRPLPEQTTKNKMKAASYAAYRALSDVLPVDIASVYKPLMQKLGYDPNNISTDIETPEGIGNVACNAVLEFRHDDKSNQLGNLAAGPYSDWSNYRSLNTPGTVPLGERAQSVKDADHWQPLTYVDSSGELVVQTFSVAQWRFIAPFALSTPDQLRGNLGPGPAKWGSEEYRRQAEELVAISAGLTDEQKMISEYWSDGPTTEQAPVHWIRLAEFVSERDQHTLDDDVKMFFVLSNAMLDAGIAAWDAKRTYDSVRPITAIARLYGNKEINAWGGPGRGTVKIEGSQWIPYQPTTFPTPPFPEFVSGHSSFSAAGAEILKLWTHSDRFEYSVTLAVGSSKIEPGITPSRPIVLRWKTFTDAADQAGISRRYGGIHFRLADVAGRKLGRAAANVAWARAELYFSGIVIPIQSQTAQ